MSRPIKMTQAYLDECRSDFEKALQLTKLADGKLSFTKTFTIGDRKAQVYFTELAWAKMTALVRDFDKEVAWHGVANRGEDESKDVYIISDIVVYPQTVSGATVEMDTEEYAKWLMENADDERFEHIHMQGHSHVNMAPNPSSVDLNHQEEILNMLGDDDFYIFMIWNKSLANNIKIYDLKKNVLFEDKDITYEHEQGDIDEFIKRAKEMVKPKTYTPPANTYQYGGRPPYGAPYNPLPAAGGGKKDEDKSDKKGKKDKKDKKDKPRTKIGAGWAGANACEQETFFDDDDDGFGGYPYGGYPYGGYGGR